MILLFLFCCLRISSECSRWEETYNYNVIGGIDYAKKEINVKQ